jgi:Pyruvate phosphate dikinase, AMP/ATP-binding domain
MKAVNSSDLPEFGREFLGADLTMTRIGSGALGGKASGLVHVKDSVLSAIADTEFPDFTIAVPTLTVLTTDVFDAFMEQNDLMEIALSDASDDRISNAFQAASFPPRYVGDLRSLIEKVHTPLAVRSSSLLEDDLDHPFAGVYGTKMIPNLQADIDTRFKKLQQAIKYVYASVYFRAAKDYIRSTGQELAREKMAVIVQEIVGLRFEDRFYPHISGVARSYNYYPSGKGKPQDGVVNLALGLGKQIVDGGISWTYVPAYPTAPPPFNNIGDQIKNSQNDFWSVFMGPPRRPDPASETEFMQKSELKDSEWDGTLTHLASSYDGSSDRLRAGVFGSGARVLNFSPILQMDVFPLNRVIRRILALAEEVSGTAVELEFAVILDPPKGGPARFGLLQMRPMMVSDEDVTIEEEAFTQPNVLISSGSVMGNGTRDDIRDIVYLKPDTFEAKDTPRMAQELDAVNKTLAAEGRHCLLVGFGRWGSSDHWLGVPVDWGQISSARVIVEATLPDMSPDLSQGSHFFHNLISFKVMYMSVTHTDTHKIDWARLDAMPAAAETEFVRHVKLDQALEIRVDGINSRGVISHSG